jgi:hypothetical protein
MHKHGSKDGNNSAGWVAQEAAGHKSPLLDKCVTGAQFHDKEQQVQRNQDVCDEWKSSSHAIIVANWEHNYLPFSPDIVSILTRKSKPYTSTVILIHKSAASITLPIAFGLIKQ